jgi:hypothetical protein
MFKTLAFVEIYRRILQDDETLQKYLSQGKAMKMFVVPSRPVYGTGMIAIEEAYLLSYARSIQGSSFSVYEYSYWHSAHKVTVYKSGEAITVERL